jgi:geranylgeranyl diphosphate synthase, type II
MIDLHKQIEKILARVLKTTQNSAAPPRLAAAMNHAVFPGGARIRPQLVLAVAGACGAKDSRLPLAAAAAIELLHCASLVHDDLPCFDNSGIRRGKPSVHAAYGERLAVLTGDALIVASFQAIADNIVAAPQQAAEILKYISSGVGMPFGIVAGQAWECEPKIALRDYHRAKTGALFAAATMSGAASAGENAAPWRELGERLGEAYQVADDLHDVATDADQLGKPVGQDALLGRPSAAADLGIEGAAEKLLNLVENAVASIPDCQKADELRMLVTLEAKRFLPTSLSRLVA